MVFMRGRLQTGSDDEVLKDGPADLGPILIFVEKDLRCCNKSSTTHCFYAFNLDLQFLVECLSNRKRLYVIVGGVGSTSVRSSHRLYQAIFQTTSDGK